MAEATWEMCSAETLLEQFFAQDDLGKLTVSTGELLGCPLLVLDDPFSALDRSTEDNVFANLQAYAKDKVVFLISHRLYHFPQMQQVVFLDGGKATVGTHEELMASVPLYRQLYESQTVQKEGDLDEE